MVKKAKTEPSRPVRAARIRSDELAIGPDDAMSQSTDGLDVEDEGSPSRSQGDPNYMMSLERGLTVIQAFSSQRRTLSISQISQKTGIPRAAVRRCLYTLSQLGFVAPEDERYFVLRPKILSLGHAYLASTPLAKAGMPVLKHVTSLLNESCSVAVLDGTEILYIARAKTSRIMTIDLDIGSRLPAYCTSMGRVMLSYLPAEELEARLKATRFVQYTANTLTTPEALRIELKKVRAQGYAVIDQELETGLRTIAVPIVNSEGATVAATSVGVHASRATVGEMTSKILPVLREAAQELALLVG
ncbi:IclR family transcriptional regulator domain-containing protein [Burkholderia sp. PU8-34]